MLRGKKRKNINPKKAKRRQKSIKTKTIERENY
jgi:hypothetical protein